MKLSNLLFSLLLASSLAPTLAACGSGDVDLGKSADEELRRRARDGGAAPKTCAELGGQCVGINATIACPKWADANQATCGVGVGCCLPGDPPRDGGGAPAQDGGSAPQSCASAGGQCVGVSATIACPRWGDPNQYSCGGGIGVGCCLPQLAKKGEDCKSFGNPNLPDCEPGLTCVPGPQPDTAHCE
jgi:hypothetical protein